MTTTAGGLRIAVLIKQVPRSADSFDPDGRLVRADDLEMNPCCRRAVAHGVRLAAASGGAVTAFTLGPERAREVLLEAQACGVHQAVHLCDQEFAGSDILATARALAAAIGPLGPYDLILAGASSTDGATAAVAPMLAELLDLPYLSPALEVEVDAGPVIRVRLQHDDADERALVRGPAVVAVAERSSAPARADRASWPAELAGRTLTAADLGAGPWGTAGSPTVVRNLRRHARSRVCAMVAGTPQEQAAAAVRMLRPRLRPRWDTGAPRIESADTAANAAGPPDAAIAARRPRPHRPDGPTVLVLIDPADVSGGPPLISEAARIADRAGGFVTVVSSEGSLTTPAEWGADALLTISGTQPRPVATALSAVAAGAWAVLAPATGWGREVLARLAVRLGTGYVVDAIALSVAPSVDGRESPRLIAHKPAGDAHLAEILTTSPQLIGVRTGYLGPPLRRRPDVELPIVRLPVDDDPAVSSSGRGGHDLRHVLDRAPVVIGVGRGVDPQDYPALEPLRARLGAELAASRPVADKGHLPRGRQLGLTGRNIAPRLYLAIGISGSANHVTGITRARTVLAINNDPDAPIFGHADIGLVADWREAVPALVTELEPTGPDRPDGTGLPGWSG